MPTNNSADIFRDLATLIEAGISVIDAAKKVALSYPSNKNWRKIISALAAGQQLNMALRSNQFISSFEQEIISVSEFSGRLPQGLRSLADSYEKRCIRINKLKSKLYLPIAVLVIAIIVSIIQASNMSESSGDSLFVIIFGGVFWLVVVFILTHLMLTLLQKDACSWLRITSRFSQNQWYKQQLQQVIFNALLWQIKSGIDFKTGFLRIKKLFNQKLIDKQLILASRLCDKGTSVSQSIIQSRLNITNEFNQILLVAEQSGQWESTVEKYLQQQAAILEIKIASAFEWLPRIFYAFVAVYAISVIL